jgi:hypothetical protein
MVRWLEKNGFQVTVLCAGSSTRSETTNFGNVITVRDPLGIYRDSAGYEENPGKETPSRKPNRLRRLAGYALFSPDLQIAWAFRCFHNTMARNAVENARLILSSSPPESAHVLAEWLAKAANIPFVMDMRDGWLDEPMKPLLLTSPFQRLRERRLESRLVRRAHKILVTSSVWKEMLHGRYTTIESKIHVITNAYPRELLPATSKNNRHRDKNKSQLEFLHAGRIQSSRPERKIEYLLRPLNTYLVSAQKTAQILFLGDLEPDEENELLQWNDIFSATGSSLIRQHQVSFGTVQNHIADADLLLLISTSRASIPAKFFDYVASGKPVLCVSNIDSAVYGAIKDIPQCHFIDAENPDIQKLSNFLNMYLRAGAPVSIPECYSDEKLEKDFIRVIEEVLIDE